MRHGLLAWLGVAVACTGERAPAATVVPFVAVSAGEDHTCAVTSGGSVFCWGFGGGGQLGAAGSEEQDRPVQVRATTVFSAVAAGGAHTCALSREGDAYCWGGNQFGEAGAPDAARLRIPTRVAGVPRLATLAAGVWRTCGVSVAGDIVCWGRDPSPSSTRPSLGAAYRSVSVSQTHVCATTTDDRVLCWGSDRSGALGSGAGNRAFASVRVAAGQSCGVTPDGDAYCWGDNRFGQMGNGGLDEHRAHPTPEPVAGGHKWRVVSAGRAHACGITRDGRILCWGSAVADEDARAAGWSVCPGNARVVCSAVPRSVGADSVRFAEVDAGGSHTCGLSTTGDVYCWGSNVWGQLGIGQAGRPTGSSVPRRVTVP